MYRNYIQGNFDVVIIGAGHAGVEAALAASRVGVRVGVFTLTLDGIANMACNPAIGGAAKSQLVREIDALGGEMARAADKTAVQVRMLGLSKGAAVQALRVQTDRIEYHKYMKSRLENTPEIQLIQAEITDILVSDNTVCGVVTHLGDRYTAKAVIIATGTYLGGRIFVGETNYDSGPDGHHSAISLSKNLRDLGVILRRFKTGTPARVKRDSIDLNSLELQIGHKEPTAFSYTTKKPLKNKRCCYVAYTNETGHEIIRKNLHRSPLFSGDIVGTGPRYCPSIEDKVVRFADKMRHQLFVEPCGLDTQEMYLQGMSSSLPTDVQHAFYKSIKGFEDIEIMRGAYAIEYDCCDSRELKATLEFKAIGGLFGAGQFCGTSGYEEAAAQGLVAGLNAARYTKGDAGIVFSSATGYIGSMINDLVTRGTNEPYRMMTSRSEYRLNLRQDNADHRLCPLAYSLSLINKTQWSAYNKRKDKAKRLLLLLQETIITPKEINPLLQSRGYTPIQQKCCAVNLLKRPEVTLTDILCIIKTDEFFDMNIVTYVQSEVKYEGYIKKQTQKIKQILRDDNKAIPDNFDFNGVVHLSNEAKEKLCAIKPLCVSQAKMIEGITPADIDVLLIALKKYFNGCVE